MEHVHEDDDDGDDDDDDDDGCDDDNDWKVWLLRVWSVSHHPPSNMQLGISTTIIKDNYDKDDYDNCQFYQTVMDWNFF